MTNDTLTFSPCCRMVSGTIKHQDMHYSDFEKYASKSRGVSTTTLDRYSAHSATSALLNPLIVEKGPGGCRSPMNVMSSLMEDGFIFLYDPIDGFVASIVVSQLLYHESSTR